MSAATRHLTPETPDSSRYTHDTAGRPALVCRVMLDEDDARELNQWFAARCAQLKERKWEGWTVADSVIRTLCVQIDSFGGRAFSRAPITTEKEG